MAEKPEWTALRRQAKEAADGVRAARESWGTSQGRAKGYLAAKENQLHVLENIQATDPDVPIGGGRIEDGIASVKRDIANIEAEIPTLRPGY
jgi:hypothetical protein